MVEDLTQEVQAISDSDKDSEIIKEDKDAEIIDHVGEQKNNNFTDIPAPSLQCKNLVSLQRPLNITANNYSLTEKRPLLVHATSDAGESGMEQPGNKIKLEQEDKENTVECNDLIWDHNKIINSPVQNSSASPETNHEDKRNKIDKTVTIDRLDVSKSPLYTKPKKASSNGILHQDYICTDYDHHIIQSIRNIPLSDEQILVQIGENDATIDRNFIDCLFQKSGRKAYLNDEVINAYISLIKAEDHLSNRVGGSVFIETTFISAMLKRDGDIEVDVNDSNEKKGMKMRISVYMNHDMVFLPINIEESHWYLAVINAKRKEIQILDSTGPKDRDELSSTLNGLQTQIEIVSRQESIPNKKWPDLNVASWQYKEVFQDHMQKDNCSCGLFMLNYIEYWEGENLTDNFNQDDITQFWTKLIAILLATDLNKHRICPVTKIDDNKIGAPLKSGVHNKQHQEEAMSLFQQ